MLNRIESCRLKRTIPLSISVFTIFFIVGFLLGDNKKLANPRREKRSAQRAYTISNISGTFTPVTVPVLVYRQNDWVKDLDICRCHSGEEDFPLMSKVLMKSFLGRIPLSVYNPTNNVIAREIMNTGSYEQMVFRTLLPIFRQHSKMSLINTGFDLGVFSVQYAKLGRPVLHMEFSSRDLQQLCASVSDNGLEYDITLASGNLRHQEGLETDCHVNENAVETNVSAKNIDLSTLNRVPTLPNSHQFRNVFLRVDLEGYEFEILKNSQKFFQSVDVKAVLINWRNLLQSSESKEHIIDFLDNLGYAPFVLRGMKRFDIDARTTDAVHVLWLQRLCNVI